MKTLEEILHDTNAEQLEVDLQEWASSIEADNKEDRMIVVQKLMTLGKLNENLEALIPLMKSVAEKEIKFPEIPKPIPPVSEVTILNPVTSIDINKPKWWESIDFTTIISAISDLKQSLPKSQDYSSEFNSIQGLLTAILAALLKEKPTSTPLFKKHYLGRGTGNPLQAYDLSSELNGSTTTFTIPTNSRVVSVHSSSAPFTFRNSVDYTYTINSLIFDAAIDAPSMLASGQSLIVLYIDA